MIGQVEDFGAKLHFGSLGDAESLEGREIHAVKTGAVELRRSSAQRGVVGLPDGRSDRGAGERRRINPVIHIVRTGGYALAGNQQGVAAVIRSRADHAPYGPWLAILQSQDPVGAPTAEKRIHGTAAVAEILPSMPEGQIVVSADMHDFRNVEITQSVVALQPEAGQSRGALPNGRAIEDVLRVGAAF